MISNGHFFVIFADIIFCLSKKLTLIELELQYQGQIAQCLILTYFCKVGSLNLGVLF